MANNNSNNSGGGSKVTPVQNNVFNTALGKVTELLSGAKTFTETQSNFGKRVGDKVEGLRALVAKLQGCKDQIRGIRDALRRCEEQSASSLAAAQSAGQQAEVAAREAGRKSGRESAAAALEAAAANFQALTADLTSLTTSMNTIDDVDLQALEREVNEICASAQSTAGGASKSQGGNNNNNNNNNNNSGKGMAQFRQAGRAVQGAEAFDRSRSGPTAQKTVQPARGAWGRGPPRQTTRTQGQPWRGGYRYGKSKSRRSTRKRSPSKGRRSAGKSGKKTRRRRRRR